MWKLSLLLVIFIAAIFPVWPQENDPASLIGLTLEDLIRRFGAPRSVYPVRGIEEWQDDVVFVYNEGDFYIMKDRVWQLGLRSAYLVRSGDYRSSAFFNLGEVVYSAEDYAIFLLKGYNWPLALRCNFDAAGRVTLIFIYRSDL